MEGVNPLTVETIILGLALYFFPINLLLKQFAMGRGIRKPCGLTVRQYMFSYIDIKEYSGFIPCGKMSDNIGVTELNEIFLNSIPNCWSKQACVQVFECKSITLKNQFTCLNAWLLRNLSMKVY